MCDLKTKKSININELFIESNVNVCDLDKEEGRCRGYFERYFYDKNSKKCQQFVYGGCGGKIQIFFLVSKIKIQYFQICLGNKNNFENEEDCNNKCAHKISSQTGEI